MSNYFPKAKESIKSTDHIKILAIVRWSVRINQIHDWSRSKATSRRAPRPNALKIFFSYQVHYVNKFRICRSNERFFFDTSFNKKINIKNKQEYGIWNSMQTKPTTTFFSLLLSRIQTFYKKKKIKVLSTKYDLLHIR